MKVILHYQDNLNKSFHKSLKITLPKSWKNGPASRLLTQFVESYNSSKTVVDEKNVLFSDVNPLDESTLHIAMEKYGKETLLASYLKPIGSDAIIITTISDRANLYIRHGHSQTTAKLEPISNTATAASNDNSNLAHCSHFGCQQKFPRGGPYPECTYHISPPVFHETAKFWSCCPNKKAYDWDDFQSIPGCQTGTCTDIRPDAKKNKHFLGGMDLREIAAEKAGTKLKSIDDFNQSQMAGGSDKAPVLVRLKNVLGELGIEEELFDQVVDGIKARTPNQHPSSVTGEGNEDVWSAVAEELGGKLKGAFKKIVVDQLRIS